MPPSWKWFRVICFFQVTISALLLCISFIRFIQYPGFGGVFRMILFLLILLLAVFAINLLKNNYPDDPVAGNQKTTFNRLFLLNFIFLSVLFGLIFGEFSYAKHLAYLLRRPVFSLPFSIVSMLLVYLVTLIFQFIIIYGLYVLRRLLYENFRKRKFEFESG